MIQVLDNYKCCTIAHSLFCTFEYVLGILTQRMWECNRTGKVLLCSAFCVKRCLMSVKFIVMRQYTLTIIRRRSSNFSNNILQRRILLSILQHITTTYVRPQQTQQLQTIIGKSTWISSIVPQSDETFPTSSGLS